MSTMLMTHKNRARNGYKAQCEYGCCYEAHRSDHGSGKPAARSVRNATKRRLPRLLLDAAENPKNW